MKKRKTMAATNMLALGLCAAAMVVLGTWMPPAIEAPQPPRIKNALSH